MKIKAIKKGNILELKENLNILDGQEIIISIADDDLLDRTYELAHQQVIAQMKVESLGNLETEEDIINAAIKLTS
ncbi:hypothetical protein [Geminocystis herdmanii]|uniref:hypothetical protein n=1 Tax=Geminocystis herdmanii TaxID=669359 RepID=UPI0003489674|nr:hypothetical protein [Geminocystis herdmanii]